MADAAATELNKDIQRLHRLNIGIKVLRHLHDKGSVEAGDLICKETTRHLVRLGYAGNTGGDASALNKVFITMKGQEFLEQVDELLQRPWDWNG